VLEKEKNKKAVIVSCFDCYEYRLQYIMKNLETKGYECTYIISDYNFMKGNDIEDDRENTIKLKTIAFQKNISFKRIASHYYFSRDVFKKLKQIQPDILYVMLPPNFLVNFAAKYKRKYNSYLFFDIYDLWPETFPSRKSKTLLSIPFGIWAKLRNKNLNKADVVVTECNFFKEKLNEYIGDTKAVTLYPLKLDVTAKLKENVSTLKEELNVCYLGSINNIIDIDKICKLLSLVNKKRKVIVHIVGKGEKEYIFKEELKKECIEFKSYGPIYDNVKKQAIFNNCALAINILKDSVCIGLTLKSIDYIQCGLPLLNNIKGDTEKFVKDYKIGINLDEDLNNTAEKIIKLDDKKLKEMRQSTYEVYDKFFSKVTFDKRVNSIFEDIKN
jgi:glycosyltransferase involved in cell wall biosynthesis